MSLTPRRADARCTNPSTAPHLSHGSRPTFAALGGRAIDRYAVGESLGAGGIGEVFLAWDTVLKRKVALKMLHGGARGSVARILREGRAAAKIEHPNAVAIYDVAEHDGGAHIVMEYIDGRPLRHFVGDRSVALTIKLRWARDVASALAAAHGKGVIHRDIKPENVMRRDADGVIKVVDFGIARCVNASGSSAPGMTSIEGGLCGTPAYMAPERTFGEKGDARSDQFTWAVFAYELLTGSLPWSSDGGTLHLLKSIGTEPAEPPSHRYRDVPRWLDAVLLRALAKEPHRRFASMGDIVAILDGAAPPPLPLDAGHARADQRTGPVASRSRPRDGARERSREDRSRENRSREEARGEGARGGRRSARERSGSAGSSAEPAGQEAGHHPADGARETARGRPRGDGASPEQLRRSLRRYRLATAALGPVALVALASVAVLGGHDLRRALGQDLGQDLDHDLGRGFGRPLDQGGAPGDARAVGVASDASGSSGSGSSSSSGSSGRSRSLGALEASYRSSNVEATDAYREGLRATHDAAAGEALRSFERATTLDPSFAAAHLRAVLASRSVSATARAHLSKATQLRDMLGEHDRDLLRAIEPWLAIPEDARESERRLAALAAARSDVDYPYQLCRFRLRTEDFAGAIGACRAARAIDPTHAGALWLEGLAGLLHGDTAAGIAAIHACLRVAPAAPSCLNDLVQLDANEGRCAASLAGAQHLVDLEPKSEVWLETLGAAAYAGDRPFGEVHHAFERSWQLSPVDAMPFVRARARVNEAILAGAFDEARRELDVWEDVVGRSVEEEDHVEAFLARAWFEREAGDPASLAAHARAFLARRAALTPDPAGGSSIDGEVALYRGLAVSRRDFVKARDAWLRRDHGHASSCIGRGAGGRWVTAYASAAVTPEDARDALAALPDYLPLPPERVRTPEIDEAIGATYLLAGRTAEALPFLRRAAASCGAALDPLHHTWANLELGEALEATDVDGACDAYHVVIARWSAAPASRSAKRARERWSVLKCR